MDKVLYVPKLSLNFLYVLDFEMDGCGMVFHQGLVYRYREGVFSDIGVVLGFWSERLYRLLGEPVVGTNGWLELESDEGEASVRGSCIIGRARQ